MILNEPRTHLLRLEIISKLIHQEIFGDIYLHFFEGNQGQILQQLLMAENAFFTVL